jgi:hypothetical protein
MDDFMRSIGGFIKKREDEVTGWTQMLGQYLGQSSDLSGGKAPMSDTLYPPVTMRPQKPLVYGQDNPYYKPQNNGMMTGGVNQQAIIPSNQGQPNRDLTNYSRKDHLVDTPGYNPFMPQPDSNGLSPVPFPGNPERAQMMLNATNEGVSSRDAFDLFNQGNQLNVPGQMNAPVAGAGLAGMSSPAGGDAGMASPYAAVPGNREETLIQKFMQRGFSRNVAIGMVAGAKSESGLDSTVNEKDPTVEGSRGGFGLFQFTGPRRLALEKFAAERNLDPADEDVQIDFASQELRTTEKGAFAKINAAETAQDAALAVVNDFLRPGKDHSAKTVEAAAVLSGEVLAPVDNKPATIESILSDLTKDPDNAEAKAKSRGQGEMWMALGKGLGQIGKGQAVDISTIVQMRQQRLDKAADTLKDKQRNTAAASLIYETTGDENLARAAFMGVVDYKDVLSKQQIDRANKQADDLLLAKAAENNALLPMIKDMVPAAQYAEIEKVGAAGGDVMGVLDGATKIDVIKQTRLAVTKNTQLAATDVETALSQIEAGGDKMDPVIRSGLESYAATGGQDATGKHTPIAAYLKEYRAAFEAPTTDTLTEYARYQTDGGGLDLMSYQQALKDGGTPDLIKQYDLVVAQAKADGKTPPLFDDWNKTTKAAGVAAPLTNLEIAQKSADPGMVITPDPNDPTQPLVIDGVVQSSLVAGGTAEARVNKAALTEAEKINKAKLQQGLTRQRATVVVRAAKSAMDIVENWDTSVLGGVVTMAMKNIPQTKANELQLALTAINNNSSLQQLQDMRASNENGAAVGQVTQGEHELFQKAILAVNAESDPKLIKEGLMNVQNMYYDLVFGSQADIAAKYANSLDNGLKPGEAGYMSADDAEAYSARYYIDDTLSAVGSSGGAKKGDVVTLGIVPGAANLLEGARTPQANTAFTAGLTGLTAAGLDADKVETMSPDEYEALSADEKKAVDAYFAGAK